MKPQPRPLDRHLRPRRLKPAAHPSARHLRHRLLLFQTSTDLKETLAPFVPIGNEHGVELYYNIGVTKWFHVTPDIRWIEPAAKGADTAVVIGVRTKVDF